MLEGKTIGFGLTGSFCTLQAAIDEMEKLAATGCKIMPVLSPNAASIDTRFGKAADFIERIEGICDCKAITTIQDAEPIGPQKLLDIMVVMPCTGNTLAKLYNGITDTAVTMACKAHLRNDRPLLLAIATNDGLSMNMRNIGGLMNLKNLYFLPFGQDDCVKKETSLIADFAKLMPSIEYALAGKKAQPQIF